MYTCVFWHIGIFFSSGRGSFSCSRLRGTQRARRNTRARVWALADFRGTCSGGSKSQVPTGRHSEHVGPSRPLQTHVQLKNVRRLMWYLGSWMPSVSSDITYLVMEKFFLDTNMPDMRPRLVQSDKSPWPRKDMVSAHAYDHSMVRPSHLRPTAVRVWSCSR